MSRIEHDNQLTRRLNRVDVYGVPSVCRAVVRPVRRFTS
jgi:hypothetical protein